MTPESKKKKAAPKKLAHKAVKPHAKHVKREHIKHEPKAEKATTPHSEPEALAEKPVIKEKLATRGHYHYSVGRRKTAMAKIKLFDEGSDFMVNGRKMEEYFPTFDLQRIATNPLNSLGLVKKLAVVSIVRGGGIHAQAEAVRHGISRALVLRNEQDKPTLKKFGFLTRDPRVVERKKPGHRKARRSPQWSKR